MRWAGLERFLRAASGPKDILTTLDDQPHDECESMSFHLFHAKLNLNGKKVGCMHVRFTSASIPITVLIGIMAFFYIEKVFP